MAMNIYVLVS